MIATRSKISILCILVYWPLSLSINYESYEGLTPKIFKNMNGIQFFEFFPISINTKKNLSLTKKTT